MANPNDFIVQPVNALGAYLGGVQARQGMVEGENRNALLKMQQQYASEQRTALQQKGQMEQQEAQRKQQLEVLARLGQATKNIAAIPDPQARAQLWDQVVEQHRPIYGDMVDQFKDPAKIPVVAAMVEQEIAKWGTPTAGIDPATGKPAFGQVDPATGKTRIVQGLTPKPDTPPKPDAPPDPRPIRQEFTTQAQPFVAVRDASRKVETATDSAAGDMSLVFGYMKMLDPGSTVREGEYALAEQARGVPETVLNMYNKALKGERLSPGQRASFKTEAKKVYTVAKRGYDQLKNQYKGIATRAGLKPEDVLIDYENDAPVEAAGGWSIEPVK